MLPSLPLPMVGPGAGLGKDTIAGHLEASGTTACHDTSACSAGRACNSRPSRTAIPATRKNTAGQPAASAIAPASPAPSTSPADGGWSASASRPCADLPSSDISLKGVDARAICGHPAAQRQRDGDLRDVPALKPGSAQLVGARLAV